MVSLLKESMISTLTHLQGQEAAGATGMMLTTTMKEAYLTRRRRKALLVRLSAVLVKAFC